MPLHLSEKEFARLGERRENLSTYVPPKSGSSDKLVAAAATLGATKRPSGRVAATVTVGLPKPDSHRSAPQVQATVAAAVRAWYLRWHPLSLVWRVVVTSVEPRPMGSVRTGRWEYVLRGYVRTTLTVDAWTAQVDAATGAILAIGPDADGPPQSVPAGVQPAATDGRGALTWWAIAALLLLALFLL
jgi:hypothetical protein